ncbi:hypothetical protein, partial [Microbacterium sp. SD291]|uniref:hypothetical protein n=1 Tax=Microbacterium sp. SD291 TaxID=2782007 RepID=UPI001A975780
PAPAPAPGGGAPAPAPGGGRPPSPPPAGGTPPGGPPPAGGTPAAGTPAAGTPAASTPAAPSAPGSGALLTFAMKAIKQEERKTLVFEYHREQAVTRNYAPQSLIGLLMEDLTGPGHFLEIDLDDPFFRSLDIEVSMSSAFEPIGLQSVAVGLDYGDAAHPQQHRHADLVFDATHTEPQHWIVPIGDDYDLSYRPRIEYHFDPQSGWAAERNEVVVEPGRIVDRTLQLDPTQHVGFIDVDVRSERLDPLEVESVEVTLAHTSSTGWSTTRTIEMRPDSTPQSWRVRTAGREEVDYTVQTTYHLVGGGTIVRDPVESRATAFAVTTPFADHIGRRLDFTIPAGQFATVIVDIRYDDGSHRVDRRIELAGDGLATTRADIGIVDPTERETTTQVTLLGADGTVVRGASFVGEAEFLTVASDGTITGA